MNRLWNDLPDETFGLLNAITDNVAKNASIVDDELLKMSTSHIEDLMSEKLLEGLEE